MIKKVNFQFISTVILYFAFFVGGIVLLAYYYSETSGSPLVVTLTFVFLLITLFVSSVANKRLNYLMNLSYQIKIRDNASEPIPLNIAKDEATLYGYLAKNDFKRLNQSKTHSSFYRVIDDNVKKIFATKMLEVVVFIGDEEKEFFLDAVDDDINKLKAKLLKDKVKVNRLFVTQFRNVDELDEETKRKINEIVFIRTRYNIISTVNVALFQKELAVMLYSDTYSPSLYYRHHIDQIKKML